MGPKNLKTPRGRRRTKLNVEFKTKVHLYSLNDQRKKSNFPRVQSHRSFFDLTKEVSGQCHSMSEAPKTEIELETSVGSDGSVSTWHRIKDGHYCYFELRRADGRLELERFYHPNGNEKLAIGYYENGAMKFKSTYDDRGVMSRQTLWTDRGQMTATTEYLNSYRHGLCVRYSEETGRLIAREEFLNDQRDGLCETYYETPGAESLKERAWYRAGQINGEFTKYFKNGNVEETGCIRDGKYVGPRRMYHQNGKLRRIWNYENGELHGRNEEFDESGQLSRVMNMASGKQHGLEIAYNKDGQVTRQTCYVNGASTSDLSLCGISQKENEVVQMYYESGELRSETTYSRGIPNGTFRVLSREGKPLEEGNHVNGKLSGRVRLFNLEGRPIEETCYKDGRKSGPRTRYFESGQISSIEEFADDNLIAIRTYFENGQIKTSKEWSDFDNSRIRYYSDKGVLLTEFECFGELLHGNELVYDETGILFSEGKFIYGFPVGVHRRYWNNGQIKFIFTYENKYLSELNEFYSSGRPARNASFFPDGSIKNEEFFKEVDIPDRLDSGENHGPKTGDAIGEYKILRSIGNGGMGDVFLAEDAALGRQVAIKTIRGTVDDESMARFLAEGRALAKIKHKNVIQIYSNGNSFGTPYIVMEYVNGWPLGSLIGKGLLGLSEQMKIFRQMIAGIAAVHSEKILHRDLKPSNVLVSQNLDVKIIDFGIAKILDDSSAGLTAKGVAIGTVKYLAPEIAAGLPASFQTDIYGVGIIFYQMLTGIVPFQGTTREETLRKILNEPLEFPEEIRTLIPEDLLSLILKMTAKSVSDRPTNCAEVLQILDNSKAIGTLRELGLAEIENPERLQLMQIRNLDEVRKNVESRGCRPSEVSLIINLACRIQMSLDAAGDKTQGVDHASSVIVSTGAIDEATARMEKARRSTH